MTTPISELDRHCPNCDAVVLLKNHKRITHDGLSIWEGQCLCCENFVRLEQWVGLPPAPPLEGVSVMRNY